MRARRDLRHDPAEGHVLVELRAHQAEEISGPDAVSATTAAAVSSQLVSMPRTIRSSSMPGKMAAGDTGRKARGRAGFGRRRFAPRAPRLTAIRAAHLPARVAQSHAGQNPATPAPAFSCCWNRQWRHASWGLNGHRSDPDQSRPARANLNSLPTVGSENRLRSRRRRLLLLQQSDPASQAADLVLPGRPAKQQFLRLAPIPDGLLLAIDDRDAGPARSDPEIARCFVCRENQYREDNQDDVGRINGQGDDFCSFQRDPDCSPRSGDRRIAGADLRTGQARHQPERKNRQDDENQYIDNDRPVRLETSCRTAMPLMIEAIRVDANPDASPMAAPDCSMTPSRASKSSRDRPPKSAVKSSAALALMEVPFIGLQASTRIANSGGKIASQNAASSSIMDRYRSHERMAGCASLGSKGKSSRLWGAGRAPVRLRYIKSATFWRSPLCAAGHSAAREPFRRGYCRYRLASDWPCPKGGR